MSARSKLIKKLDKVFSKFIRERDRSCLYCGKTENLQCAHIVPRTYLNLRWDERNCITLCYRHHLYWAHKDPLEFVAWIRNKFPGLEEYLIKKKNECVKYDKTKIEELLEVYIDKVKNMNRLND